MEHARQLALAEVAASHGFSEPAHVKASCPPRLAKFLRKSKMGERVEWTSSLSQACNEWVTKLTFHRRDASAGKLACAKTVERKRAR